MIPFLDRIAWILFLSDVCSDTIDARCCRISWMSWIFRSGMHGSGKRSVRGKWAKIVEAVLSVLIMHLRRELFFTVNFYLYNLPCILYIVSSKQIYSPIPANARRTNLNTMSAAKNFSGCSRVFHHRSLRQCFNIIFIHFFFRGSTGYRLT
jgi:hypothetical protein